MLRKTIAALGVAAITVLAVPTAAFAAPDLASATSCSGVSSDNYARSGSVTSNAGVIDPGGTVTVTWGSGYFTPGSAVTVVTSGTGSTGSRIVTADSTGQGSAVASADSAGGLTASVTVSSTAAGSLSVQGMSDGSCGGVTVQVAGVADPAGDTASSLAFTGGSLPVVLVVSGTGAFAFGLILLAARARSRRRTQP